MHRSPALRSFWLLLIVSLIVLSACKKSTTGPKAPTIDPGIVGVWYSSDDSLGFEVLSDGTSKTLVIDTAGKLQYAPASGAGASGLSLAVTQAQNGNLTALVTYKVPGFIDTTLTLPGVYTLSNNNNTLSITFPNPLTGGQPFTIVFQRSSIGAVVRPKSASASVYRLLVDKV